MFKHPFKLLVLVFGLMTTGFAETFYDDSGLITEVFKKQLNTLGIPFNLRHEGFSMYPSTHCLNLNQTLQRCLPKIMELNFDQAVQVTNLECQEGSDFDEKDKTFVIGGARHIMMSKVYKVAVMARKKQKTLQDITNKMKNLKIKKSPSKTSVYFNN